MRRTPLLDIGYLTFSFGFASLALFLLKGEEIKGVGGNRRADIDRLSHRLCAALFRAHADLIYHRSDRCSCVGPHRPGMPASATRTSPFHQDDSYCLAVRNLFQCDLVDQTKILRSSERANPRNAASPGAVCRYDIGRRSEQDGRCNKSVPGCSFDERRRIVGDDAGIVGCEAAVICYFGNRFWSPFAEHREDFPEHIFLSYPRRSHNRYDVARSRAVLASLGCLRDRYSLADSSAFSFRRIRRLRIWERS